MRAKGDIIKHNRMSMLGSGSESSDYEPLPKKLKLLGSVADVQSRMDATEEAALKALILDECSVLLELCRNVSDALYRRLLRGVAMFFYLLFGKDDLCRVHHSENVHRQRREFWEELESKCEPFVKMRKQVYEACKWIVHKKSDLDKYSFLNEYDLATVVKSYGRRPQSKPLMFEYKEYDEKCQKSAIDDDIQLAIRDAQSRLGYSVDRYTSLLLEMATEESTEFQDLLFDIAVGKIDDKAFHGLDVSSNGDLFVRGIESSEEFYESIRLHFMKIFSVKKFRVKREALSSVMPYILLFNIEFFDGPPDQCDMSKVEKYRRMAEQRPSVDEVGLIKVAELRRRAEGSRFINRDHFLWAFEKSGWGLRAAFKDKLASRIAAEGHPPYHIYMTALKLAQAVQEAVEAEHLAFAVVFAKDFVISKKKAKQLQKQFKGFRTALHMHCPNSLTDWFKNLDEDEW